MKSPIASSSSGTAAAISTRTPRVSRRWASQEAFVFATSPEVTSLPIVRRAALIGTSCIVAEPGTYLPAGVPQRSRCESGAVPQLRCPAKAVDEPGRLCRAERTSPRRKGRSCGSPPEPTSSADKRRFFVVKVRIAGLLALALTLGLVPAAAPAGGAAPQRIVSLPPTATEDLFAIGAGRQVVAVDDQSNYPKSAPKTK